VFCNGLFSSIYREKNRLKTFYLQLIWPEKVL